MTLYRFALWLDDYASEVRCLGFITADNDSQAFNRGCAVFGVLNDTIKLDAPSLAQHLWSGYDDTHGDPYKEAFYTVEPVETLTHLLDLAADGELDLKETP